MGVTHATTGVNTVPTAPSADRQGVDRRAVHRQGAGLAPGRQAGFEPRPVPHRGQADPHLPTHPPPSLRRQDDGHPTNGTARGGYRLARRCHAGWPRRGVPR